MPVSATLSSAFHSVLQQWEPIEVPAYAILDTLQALPRLGQRGSILCRCFSALEDGMPRFIVITDGYSPEVRLLADRIVVVEELDHDQFRWVIDLAPEDEPLLREAGSTAHIERAESWLGGLTHAG